MAANINNYATAVGDAAATPIGALLDQLGAALADRDDVQSHTFNVVAPAARPEAPTSVQRNEASVGPRPIGGESQLAMRLMAAIELIHNQNAALASLNKRIEL